MSTTIFELEKVSYRYPNGCEGFRDVCMRVFKGERVAITGPNGGGKSTLLKVLDALLVPYHGTLKIFGERIDENVVSNNKYMYRLRRRIGLVFQDPDVQLFSPTVWDDIAFGPVHLGLSRDEVAMRVDLALDELKIRALKDRHPYNLSEGEKRKVAIASVLSINPDVILLDEPTAHLDPESRHEIIEVLNELNKRGKTIIIALHDVNAIPEIADRMYIMDRNIIAEGTPREIFSNPELLTQSNLDVPEIARLFKLLKFFGYECEETPLSVEEALNHLLKNMKTLEECIHPSHT